MGLTLGEAEGGGFRQDVWVVELSVSGETPKPEPKPEPKPTPEPATSPRYVYESRPWPATRAAQVQLINSMGALGYRWVQTVASTAYFEKKVE
jgi:hypothetical protein